MIVKTNDIHYKNIAKTMANRSDAGASLLRSEYPNGILPSEMPDIIAEIVSREYQNGYNFGKEEGRHLAYNEGKEAGIVEGVEIGRKAEYDAFWENHLAYAKRTGIAYLLFGGAGWNENTRIPYKIDFIKDGYNMFMYCGNIPKSEIAKIDFSKITNNFPSFNYSTLIRELPELDTRGVTAVGIIFAYCSELKSIDKIIFRDDGSQSIGPFTNCTSLEEVRFEGTFGQNGLNLQWSNKLSAASIESIINALSSTTSDLPVTLSKGAVQKAFETSEGANDGNTSDEWLNLIATKNNWTVTLV